MVKEVTKEESNTLFAAFYNPIPLEENNWWSLKPNSHHVDVMDIPDDFKDIIEYCRFFYEHDGLAYTTINKQVEIGINGFLLNRGDCTETEMTIYSHVNDLVLRFLRKAALEFLLSGLVIPEITWDRIPAKTIDPKLRRSVELPVDLWTRDPMSIKLFKTPFPNRVFTAVEVSEDDKIFIENEGQIAPGLYDRETYNLLVKKFPLFVAAVKAGKTLFELKPPMVIRRNLRSGTVYPLPYLQPALELMLHKRNLRKMDYAIASRVISAIQLFKIGNDMYPLLESDSDTVAALKSQMLWRNQPNNFERVFQLFANHTLEIQWVSPDVKALLDEGKYRSINEDILTALGLPRVLISGEASRSGASDSSVAMLPPINTIKSLQDQLLEFPKYLYHQIKEKNNLSHEPIPGFPPIQLHDLRSLLDVGESYFTHGVISKTGWAELGGFDFAVEAKRMSEDQALIKKFGIPEFAPVPFSPRPGQDGQDKQQPNGGEGNMEDKQK